MTAAPGGYCGRFAPSPTGPLHFGSLVAALGSCLEARRNDGRWLLRIDDIDPAREQAGAADAIRRTLERFGFRADDEVVYQSRRTSAYAAALDTLRAEGHAFPCGCTRKQILASGTPGPNGVLYPGTCREGLPPGAEARTWRARSHGVIAFDDAFHGRMECDLAAQIGDFLLRRADGWPAYHLAAAVDDLASGITHVVRGFDLVLCTPPQILLMEWLGGTPPRYAHLPLATDERGRKLSKQNRARPLDDARPAEQLVAALTFLRQAPPPELARATPALVWQWAEAHWDPSALTGVRSATLPDT